MILVIDKKALIDTKSVINPCLMLKIYNVNDLLLIIILKFSIEIMGLLHVLPSIIPFYYVIVNYQPYFLHPLKINST